MQRARDKLRSVLIRDDRDEIAAELLRYGDANGDGWADVIDTARTRCAYSGVRLWVGVVIAFVVLLTACDSNEGVHQAEVLPTPLPGVVLSANAHGKCVTDGCRFSYLLRFTNPMDRDVNVQECHLVNESLRLPLTTIAGVEISANGTTTASATYLLPIDKSAANGLVGQPITCTGLDWHGNPPI